MFSVRLQPAEPTIASCPFHGLNSSTSSVKVANVCIKSTDGQASALWSRPTCRQAAHFLFSARFPLLPRAGCARWQSSISSASQGQTRPHHGGSSSRKSQISSQRPICSRGHQPQPSARGLFMTFTLSWLHRFGVVMESAAPCESSRSRLRRLLLGSRWMRIHVALIT